MSVSLVPINNESWPGLPWAGTAGNPAGGYNALFAGAHFNAGILYAIAYKRSGSSTVTGAEIWKSSDAGSTWTVLAMEPGNVTPAEWNGTFTYCWNDTSNIITFFLNHTGRLVDFNAATNTWGLPYGGNWVGAVGFPKITRLSDGRIMGFYTGSNTAVQYNLCWAVANTSGSGLWDSQDHALTSGGTSVAVWGPQSVAVDAANRCHLIYARNQSPYIYSYLNIDSSYTVSASQAVPGSNSQGGNIIVGGDGNLYYSFLYPGTDYTVDVWVATSLTAPVWTHEVVVDYGTGSTFPAWSFLAWVNSALTVFWVKTVGGSPPHESVWYSTRTAGAWSAPALEVDFSVTSPPSPINDQGNGYWNLEGVSAGAVASGPNGFGVVVAVDVGLPDASTGLMAFYVSGTSTPPPPTLSLACPTGAATVGTPYSGALVVSGGTAPYTFALTSGPLPPGLSLNTSTGMISGTPTTAGSYPYAVKVTDSSGVVATATVSCSIAVSKPAVPTNPSNVEFILRRVYVSMVPNKRVPVRGR